MKFNYSAKTQDGLATKKGQIEAPDLRTAIALLRDKRLIVYSMLPAQTETSVMGRLSEMMGVSLNDKVKFTEYLSSMLLAGLPLTKALELMVFQTNKKSMNTITESLLRTVESGGQLSAGLIKHIDTFGEAYISLVRAGEASGQLAEVLQRLAVTLEKQREFKAKIIGALIYPIIVTVAMVGVFVIIVVFVVPQMTAVYESFDVVLPFSTRALIAISDFIVGFWWIIVIILAGIIGGLKVFTATDDGKYVFSKMGMRTPLIGGLIRYSNLVQFSRTLALLIQSGVPIIEALKIVRDSVYSIIYKESVDVFIEDVRHGFPLSQSITQDKNFPPMVGSMAVIGEETGSIDKQLESVAKYYEGEVDKIIKGLSTAIEPLIMIVLGAMVGLLIVSVILPIYQLTTSF
ncbi:MAG: hypothetical protein QG570_163 [Patescibacteria group bacterium]|nr:hypothetical protein [Patescibacteria group bacterium]